MPKKGEIKDRKGEIHITNQGYTIKIIEYFNDKNCTILFENGFVLHNKQYGSITKGEIKNPYHKSVYGVGFIGVGNHNSRNGVSKTKMYNSWYGMFNRSYSETRLKKLPAYIGCSVAEEWHNFQNFGNWFEKNYNPETMQGWAIDKDILTKGNKIYSSYTCAFVPEEINSLLIKRGNFRGNLPIGVAKVGNKFYSEVSMGCGDKVYLGIFDTIEEAFQAYKTAKEGYIKKTAGKWKGKISDNVYQALINYQVEITD